MADSQVVNIQIFGSEYRIATEADPARTREAAHVVDRKMKEVANALSLRSVRQISVLTAINLADELFRLQSEGKDLNETASVGARRLADTLNRP